MKLYKNVLEEKERKKLLKFVKTKVRYWNDKVPGLQTPMDLHTHAETQYFYKKILQKYFKDMSIQYSWANYSEGDIESLDLQMKEWEGFPYEENIPN